MKPDVETKSEWKPYVYSAVGFTMALYLFAYLCLSILTTINRVADYPLYNFLGSEVDLSAVVLKLMPAGNPYYLPQWSGSSSLSMVVSAVFMVAAIFVTVKFARQVIKRGRMRALLFALFVVSLSVFIFKDIYTSIGAFLSALMRAG